MPSSTSEVPFFDTEMFEVKLGDKFLMSSPFAASEIALASMGAGAANAGQLSLTAAAATVAGFLLPLPKALTPVDRLEMEAAE